MYIKYIFCGDRSCRVIVMVHAVMTVSVMTVSVMTVQLISIRASIFLMRAGTVSSADHLKGPRLRYKD